MSQRNILDGEWRYIASEEAHGQIIGGGRVRRGDYVGPGKYWMITYQERCPRGCCFDDVRELVPAAEVAAQVREKMRDLADILRIARTKE